MTNRTKWLTGLAVVLTVGTTSIAGATPYLNPNGDYVGSTTDGYMKWQVVDPDPNGLNCRMANEFQPAVLDGADTPAVLYENNRHDVGRWPVVFSFQTGETLEAVIGNARFNQIMVLDRQGKPWLGVSTYKGDCFVRANQRYVQPIGEPGFQE